MGTLPLSPLSSNGYSTDEEEAKILFIKALGFSYARANLSDEVLLAVIEDEEALDKVYAMFHEILDGHEGKTNDDVFRMWQETCPSDFLFNEDDPSDAEAANAVQVLDPRISDAIERLVPSSISSTQVLFGNYFSHVAALLNKVASFVATTDSGVSANLTRALMNIDKQRSLLNKVISFAGGSKPVELLDSDLGTDKDVAERVNQLCALTVKKGDQRGTLQRGFTSLRDIHPNTPLWFQFTLENPSDREAAIAAVELDPVLSSSKSLLVPKEMTETTYFFNYFTHVLTIRDSIIDQIGNKPKNESEVPGSPALTLPTDSDLTFESQRDLVLVGSTNPMKLRACEQAFLEAFPKRHFRFVAVDTESGVPDQPMSDRSTYQGAINRATACYKASQDNLEFKDAQFFVGMEGGVRQFGLKSTTPPRDGETPPPPPPTTGPAFPVSTLECFAWIAVYNAGTEMWGTARSASFPLPSSVQKLIRQGVELGKAGTQVLGKPNASTGEGVVGVLTKGSITRLKMYQHATVMALVPFLNVNHYMSSG